MYNLFRRSRRLRRPSQSSRRKRRRSRHWNRWPTQKNNVHHKSDPFFGDRKTPPKPWTLNFIFDCFLTIFGRFRVMSIRNSFSKRISRTIWARNFQKRCLRYWLKWSAWSKTWRWKLCKTSSELWLCSNSNIWSAASTITKQEILFKIEHTRRGWFRRSHDVRRASHNNHGFESYHQLWNTSHAIHNTFFVIRETFLYSWLFHVICKRFSTTLERFRSTEIFLSSKRISWSVRWFSIYLSSSDSYTCWCEVTGAGPIHFNLNLGTFSGIFRENVQNLRKTKNNQILFLLRIII